MKNYIIGAGVLGIVALKFAPKVLVALGIGAAAAAWSASDVQDYVNNTNNSEFIGHDVGDGYIVESVAADGKVFVTNINVISDLIEMSEEKLFMERTSFNMSCDGDTNQDILSNVEAYRDVYRVNGTIYHTVTTTIGDCDVK